MRQGARPSLILRPLAFDPPSSIPDLLAFGVICTPPGRLAGDIVAKAGERECEIVADAKAGKPRLERTGRPTLRQRDRGPGMELGAVAQQ
jgi:hypothetical protein